MIGSVTSQFDAEAVILLTNAAYWRQIGWTPPDRAVGRLRVALRNKPLSSSDRPTGVHTVGMREQQADVLAPWCEKHGEILKTLPDQPDRANGDILLRAARDLREGMRLSAARG